jgi:ketosteroid isomerase-like protein
MMPKYRMVVLLSVLACLFAGAFSVISAEKRQSQALENEQTLWNLEHEYWRYVQENDLPAYLGLWHKDFLGWPSVSAAPVRKDHITDWITSQTSKGFAFKALEFKPAAIQMTGDIAVLYYWMTFSWPDKDGKGAPHTLRVTHTWLKDGKDWRIIGGMSMQEAANPQK